MSSRTALVMLVVLLAGTPAFSGCIDTAETLVQTLLKPFDRELPEPSYEYITPLNGTVDDGVLETQHYTWRYLLKTWNWDVELPVGLYEYYQDRHRPETEDYSVYVTHPADDAYVEALAERLYDAAEDERYGSERTVNFIAAFVQSLEYTSDNVTTGYDEYPRYPLETLYDHGGDCEDTAILTAALLDAVGYDVVLIRLPEHMALGVAVDSVVTGGTYFARGGTEYYYLETTVVGWRLGQMPDEYEGVDATLYPIEPVPILTQHWRGTTVGDKLSISISLENQGTADAENVTLYAGYETADGTIWNRVESDAFDLPAGWAINVTLHLREPADKYTRILVQAVLDGAIVDERRSEWFST